MKFPLKEPTSARYLYLSPENIVHVYMPVVSGTTIGLDNTCKAVYALQEFFDKGTNSNKKVSLKAELLAYKEALEDDISILEKDAPVVQQKQSRLAQIKSYLNVLEVVDKHPQLNCLQLGSPSYPGPLEGMMQDQTTSNLYSMVLRPREQDIFLRGHHRIFTVNRSTDSVLFQTLQGAYLGIDFSKTKTAKTRLMGAVLASAEAKANDFYGMARVLAVEVKKQFNVDIDTSKNSQGVALDKEALLSVLGEPGASDYVDGILVSCAKHLFGYLIDPGLVESNTGLNYKDIKAARARIKKAVLASAEAKTKDFEGIAQLVAVEFKKQFDVDIDTTKNEGGTALTKEDALAILGLKETTASDCVEGILGFCAENLFEEVIESPFYLIENENASSEEGKRREVEKLSITTQFFLAQANAYCVAKKMSTAIGVRCSMIHKTYVMNW